MIKKKRPYLTMEEKEELAIQGKNIPICIGSSNAKNSFIAKIKGTIFDGTITHKKIRL